MDNDSTKRDGKGRFASGNRGGPGRPRGRREELRRAAEKAITPEHMAAVMRRALRRALEGDLTAARFVWDRVCGRPAEAPGESTLVEVALPNLRTAADCMTGLDQLMAGILDGTCDRATAKLLLDAINVRLKAIDTTEHEQRLAELEESVKLVQGPQNRRKR